MLSYIFGNIDTWTCTFYNTLFDAKRTESLSLELMELVISYLLIAILNCHFRYFNILCVNQYMKMIRIRYSFICKKNKVDSFKTHQVGLSVTRYQTFKIQTSRLSIGDSQTILINYQLLMFFITLKEQRLYLEYWQSC